MDSSNNHMKKTVLLGITGGIAAYKSAELVRSLQKRGHNVMCVMTRHACEFIGPTTLRGLTGHPVALDDFENPSAPMHHLSLAQSCDVFAIVPATANVMAKIAWGVADDLLTTTAVATKAPVVIAPAMNTAMWQSKQNQDALLKLKERGVSIIEPAEGYLACGDVGEGKLADLDAIVQGIEAQLSFAQDLSDTTVLVTAGPTRERIDAVRYLSNDSSGKMGYALAQQAQRRGARVILVSGPTQQYPPRDVEVIRVESAQEMLTAGREVLPEVDIIIGAAAVSDYRPREVYQGKTKRDGSEKTLSLVENPDVIATLASELKQANSQGFVVAFAAEVEHICENALVKLDKKSADLIVANDVSREDIGFNASSNEVILISKNEMRELQKSSKEQIAFDIIEYIVRERGNR